MNAPGPIEPAEAGFLEAIRANPDDDTARLAYADWLEDRGDPRAALVRLEVETRLPPPERVLARDRLRQVYAGDWATAVQLAPPVPLSDHAPAPSAADGYTQPVSRASPACVVFLIGHGAWLRAPAFGTVRTWGEAAGDLVNRALTEFIHTCEKGEDRPRNFFTLGVFGYGEAGAGPALAGALAGRNLVSVVELYDHPLEIERRLKKQLVDDGAGGLVEVEHEVSFPVWYRPPEPAADSPMSAGFNAVRRVLEEWIAEHPDSFPPIVLHLTDGGATDGDPEPAAAALRGVATRDGRTVLLNICASPGHGQTAFLPFTEEQLFTDGERRAFRLSSELPSCFRRRLEVKGIATATGARGFAVNTTRLASLLSLSWDRSAPPPFLPAHLR